MGLVEAHLSVKVNRGQPESTKEAYSSRGQLKSNHTIEVGLGRISRPKSAEVNLAQMGGDEDGSASQNHPGLSETSMSSLSSLTSLIRGVRWSFAV